MMKIIYSPSTKKYNLGKAHKVLSKMLVTKKSKPKKIIPIRKFLKSKRRKKKRKRRKKKRKIKKKKKKRGKRKKKNRKRKKKIRKTKKAKKTKRIEILTQNNKFRIKIWTKKIKKKKMKIVKKKVI